MESKEQQLMALLGEEMARTLTDMTASVTVLFLNCCSIAADGLPRLAPN